MAYKHRQLIVRTVIAIFQPSSQSLEDKCISFQKSSAPKFIPRWLVSKARQFWKRVVSFLFLVGRREEIFLWNWTALSGICEYPSRKEILTISNRFG